MPTSSLRSDVDATLFSNSKWKIIQILSAKPSSPLQIAKRLGTSIANVSQQLRILEAYKLVRKERTSNTGAGKPRTIYRLTRPQAFIAMSSPSQTSKSLIPLDLSDELQIRIWSETGGSIKRVLKKWANNIDVLLPQIQYIGIIKNLENSTVRHSSVRHIKLLIIANDAFVGRLKNICSKSFTGYTSPSYSSNSSKNLYTNPSKNLPKKIHSIHSAESNHSSERISYHIISNVSWQEKKEKNATSNALKTTSFALFDESICMHRLPSFEAGFFETENIETENNSYESKTDGEQ